MATQQRSRAHRTSSSRHRGPRHVEAVLDPTWQNPYAPSGDERESHSEALRRFALRRKRPQIIVFSVLVVALLAGTAVSPWLALAAVLLAGVGIWDVRRFLSSFERRGATLGAVLLSEFPAGGTTKDRQRLVTVMDRLTATFGVDGVSAFIVDDPGYNAALAPNGASWSLFVTSALMRDFELIELEGVVAHCLARQRLGVIARQSASAVVNVAAPLRRDLAGPGVTYRADEVAAAAIRYPLGIAGALRKCARQVVPATSYFASANYERERFIWFDVSSDRAVPDLADLDDVELRALALEEW
jgi:hypothetical protein